MHHSCSTDFAPHNGLFHWGVPRSHLLGKEHDVAYGSTMWYLMMHHECEDGSFDRRFYDDFICETRQMLNVLEASPRTPRW